MWKVSVPICFYLFPVCSPKYEPEVFVLVFFCFVFKLCLGRDWGGGVKCLLRALLQTPISLCPLQPFVG